MQRRRYRGQLCTILSLVVLVVSGWLDGSAAPIHATAPSSPGSGSILFLPLDARPPDPNVPLQAEATLETGRAGGQYVPLAGRVVVASGGDGSRYTLTIPADALTEAITVPLTPVSAIGRLPLTPGAAVQIDPAGTQLFNFAALQIEPATAIPLGDETAFAYHGAGDALPDILSIFNEMNLTPRRKVAKF